MQTKNTLFGFSCDLVIIDEVAEILGLNVDFLGLPDDEVEVPCDPFFTFDLRGVVAPVYVAPVPANMRG